MNRTRRSLTFSLGAAAFAPWRIPAPPVAARPVAARVLVVGAGFAGATCAKYVRALCPEAAVTLIDQHSSFLTGPFRNRVVTDLLPVEGIRRNLADIGHAHRVHVEHERVLAIDPVKRSLRTASGRQFEGDFIIVAPGIQVRFDMIEGLDAESSSRMPHAWVGDEQVPLLRERFAVLRNGDVVVISAPPNPFRCPPGPYERATLMAFALARRGFSRCKIFIADSKDDFSKSGLFKLAWDSLYPGMIEWLPRAAGGEVVRVDTHTGEVWLRSNPEPIKSALASIIPPQRAATAALEADLADESGWCPIHAATFESARYPRIYVLGDAAVAAPMPKSAFAANSQAKLCACAITAAIRGEPAPDPKFLNTCYSFISDHAAISVSGLYAAVGGRLSALHEAMSPLAGDEVLRAEEGTQALAWYRNITTDSFGAHS